MKLPTAEESLFSIKTFIGAMAAMYLSMLIDLPRPFWAVTTAYIVAQPLAGAVRSKALFRLAGTFFGCAVVVYLVPRLSNYPVLMVAAISLWVGICLYIAVLDRTPRSYVFMLAGYTAAMIGLPSVTAPETIFDTGLARVEEISAGIVCAMLAHSLILPRGIGSAVIGKLDLTLRDARAWIRDALRGDTTSHSARDRRAFANDITQLRLLVTHAPYDVGNIRWTSRSVAAMQDRMAALTPTLSSLEDRLRVLRASGRPLPAELPALLDDILAWIEAGVQGDRGQAVELRERADRLMPRIDGDSDWHALLMVSMATRLRQLIDQYARGFVLRRDIQAGLSGAHVPTPPEGATSNRALHRDHGVALLSSLAAVVAISVCSAFWIGSAWTNGATAAMMAAIFSCFFAAQDNPVTGIMQFQYYTLLSIPLSAVYLLGVLPAVHSFEMVVLTMFPVCFLCGVYIARPASTGKALAVFLGFSGTLALHDTNTADLVSFTNTMIAQIIGITCAAVVAAIMRKISAQYSARRIQAANWRELIQLASADRPPQDDSYTVRMLDRIGLLYTRLATSRPDEATVEEDTLLDLRVGEEIVQLQRARGQLPVADAAIRPVLACLTVWFRGRIRGRSAKPEIFLPRLDQALSRVSTAPAGAARERAIVALVGLRRGLFPQAADYTPAFADGAAVPPQHDSGARS
ncbi:MAG TPA: FUSC family protein [Bordetella sp.]|nr:FUSC family protein [Bordetella sp.]